MVNTCAGTASVAKSAPPSGDTECEKAANQNRDKRGELERVTSDQTLVGPPGSNGSPTGEGTAISTAIVRGPEGGTRTLTAHNNNKAHEKISGLVPGAEMKDKIVDGKVELNKKDQPKQIRKSSLDCDADDPYQHPGDSCQTGGHAEARIMDTIGSAGRGSSVVFSIDWRPSGLGGIVSKIPCENCHKMLCYAQDKDKCNMKVSICDRNGEPVDLKDFCPSDVNDNHNMLELRINDPKTYAALYK